MTALEFVGLPFDPTAWNGPAEPEPERPEHPERAVRDVPVLSLLRSALVEAHSTALRAQEGWQRVLLATPAAPEAAQEYGTTHVPSDETAFKPLARTQVVRFGHAELRRLADGDVPSVFGSRYDQQGANPDVRLTGGIVLTDVRGIGLRGGAHRRGLLSAGAVPGADPLAVAVQAAELFALYTGLHLCLADATFVRLPGESVHVGAPGEDVELEVEEIDLVPRPHLKAHVRIGGTVVRDLTLALREKPGVPVGPERGGFPSRWLGRVGVRGEQVLLSEFHLTHLARGDQGVALGPEFAHYTGIKATRLPTGGLLLVDRVVEIDGVRGELDAATYRTEYDSPADAWYYADTANASMPNCVYMETSLQAALLIGYHLGATLSTPDTTLSLRNLGGTATVLREVDLRDRTIEQRSTLLATTLMTGSSLQTFGYELETGGVPFYRGETMFGYFSDAALANQTGLDAGRDKPTWLESSGAAVTGTIDVAGRRAAGAPLTARDHLALLDEVSVVDGGGEHGAGYLWARRAIDPDDWFFARHFHLDPVIPGSLGVESVVVAMQEWLLASGHAADLRDPGFVLPVGVPFSWKYRGQFLPTDGASTLEVHIKDVLRKPGRVRVIGDASVWKPGLRIYELIDIAVELREEGAEPW
ncbi:beta-ketoacyl synthase [Actinosynnema sp. NPDC020468]|uniref:beta-ketoacyl synthase n=1 Tax=Actinosynnema sp. NPDC020468 TaxID=3154488 RepID=UPI0033C51BE4